MKKKIILFILPLIAVLVSSLVLFTTADKKVQDIFQRPLKETVESNTVIMVNVDDYSVENIGSWPFNRDVYAKSVVVLKELGAESVVFDLSFLDKSPSTVDLEYVNEKLPSYIKEAFTEMADGYMDINDALNSVLVSVSHVVTPYDEILAQSLKFFGNSYICFPFDNVSKPKKQEREVYSKYVSFKNITAKNDTKTPEYSGALFALTELVENANGAGFINADTDSDGYLRRLYPFFKYNGEYYGQLVLVPLLNRFGNPEVEITNRYVTLKNARINETTVKDIRIPRDNNGSIILKYPKHIYDEYNKISLWNPYSIFKDENLLYEQVSVLNENGYFSLVDENPKDYYDAAQYIYNELVLNGESEGISFDAYKEYKDAFYSAMKVFVSQESENNLIETYAYDDEEFAQEIKANFKTLREFFTNLEAIRNEIKEKVSGAMCIFGTNATSTSDFGVNQYQSTYPNPGAHYTFANQIISEDFVDDTIPLVSIIIALVLCIFYSLLASKIKGTGRQIILGFSMIVGSGLLIFIYYVITRQYPGFVVPELSLAITFIITTIVGFLAASKDKKFITNAFSQCLSKEVVAEIVANPESFKLGGQRLDMTAIFTDIQKFSSFSELLTANQLVCLLNYYLTKMSDIIMDERGTVDKYEGDAIIALVGAPVNMEDHATRAVSAALKMKAAEAVMNNEIQSIASGEKPEEMEQDLYDAFKIMVQNNKTIYTRIGLNSGEMIAGYMGSENKKNYTMMGNNVNLASRLEGVNKQYRTSGILMSEATKNRLDDRFIVRRLDRVRVVNVNTPIRLYEPLGLKDADDGKLAQYVEAWEKTMDIFEAKNYRKAYDCLTKLSVLRPSDNVVKYYMSLLEKFFLKGTVPTEADDVGVEYQEDGVFKLLQK